MNRAQEISTLVIGSQFDKEAALRVDSQIQSGIRLGDRMFAIDMTDASIEDPRLFGSIVCGLGCAIQAGGTLVLVNPDESVISLIDRQGLSKAITTFRTIQEATAYLEAYELL